MNVSEISSQNLNRENALSTFADRQTRSNLSAAQEFGRISDEKIIVKVFKDETTFADLREDWQKLFAQTNAAPFLSWEWSSAWFEFFGKNRQPFVLTAYRGAELLALLPLCYEKKRIFGMSFGKLSFIGAEIGGAAYLDALFLPDAEDAAISVLRDFLAANRDFDVLELAGVAADSDFLRNLSAEFDREKFRLNSVPFDVCQFVEVRDWASADDFLTRIYNDTAKKKLKRLKKLSGFEFRRIVALAETAQAFERFSGLHDGNWTAKGGSDVTGHAHLIDFHCAAVNSCASAGTVFFDELWVENKCIASLYGLMRDEVYFYYSSGFDADYFKFSPMATLYNLSIENGIGNGVKVFDFLCGGQTYKAHWTNGKNELVTARLSRKSAAATASESFNAIETKLRDFSRKIIPANALEKIKAVRRQRKRESLQTAA